MQKCSRYLSRYFVCVCVCVCVCVRIFSLCLSTAEEISTVPSSLTHPPLVSGAGTHRRRLHHVQHGVSHFQHNSIMGLYITCHNSVFMLVRILRDDSVGKVLEQHPVFKSIRLYGFVHCMMVLCMYCSAPNASKKEWHTHHMAW